MAFGRKVFFNMELFPGTLFGKPWLLDGQQGVFPRQPQRADEEADANCEIGERLAPLPDALADRDHLEARDKGYSPIVADDLVALPYAQGRRFTAGRTTPTTASPSRARPATSPSTTAA